MGNEMPFTGYSWKMHGIFIKWWLIVALFTPLFWNQVTLNFKQQKCQQPIVTYRHVLRPQHMPVLQGGHRCWNVLGPS